VGGGDARDRREPVVVRAHHHGDDGHRDAEPPGPLRLAEDEPPVAGPAPGVLLGLGREVERELHVAQPAKLFIVEHARAVAVGGEGDDEPARVQLVEDRPELRVQPVLAGPEVHGADREAVANPAHVGERETIDPLRVAVAVRAGEVAVVRESETNREARRGRRHRTTSSPRAAPCRAIRRKRTSARGGPTGSPYASAYG